MKHVRETHGRKENKNENNDENEELSCNEEKEEDEQHHKILNDRKRSNVAMSDKKSKRKAIKCYADEGDHEKERKEVECASVQLAKYLKGDVEKSCVMCEKLKEDSICTEAIHEVLVENLKDELCRVVRNSKDECCLEAEDTKKTIEKTFIWTLEKNVLKDERRLQKRNE